MLSQEWNQGLASMQRSVLSAGFEADIGLCDRAWVEIDRAALAWNTQQIKRLLSPQTTLLAVVKADAYGHGSF